MTTVRGTIVGPVAGAERPVEARVHVLASTGQFRAPPDAVLKVGGGPPSFYADGAFALELPPGPAEFVLERGTEFRPLRQIVDVPRRGTAEVTFRLERWIDLRAGGWHAGNTHIHYDEHERRPDERLRLDPRVEDLSVAVVSILQRRELAYASNRFPVGFAGHLSGAALAVDVGEESRHNRTPWEIGYGHVMLLGLQDVVQPVSRGVLAGRTKPQSSRSYQTSHSGSIQYGSKRLKASSRPRAAATGASIPFPLWHQTARPPWAWAASQASTRGG